MNGSADSKTRALGTRRRSGSRFGAALNTGHFEHDFRAWVVAGVAAVLALAGIFLIIDDIRAQQYGVAAAEMLLPALALLTCWFLAYRNNTVAAANTLTVALLLTCAAVLVMSGGRATGPYVGLPAAVLVASVVGRRRVAVAATIGCVLIAATGIWLTTTPWQFPLGVDAERAVWGMGRVAMLVCIINLAVLSLFRASSDRIRARLLKAQADSAEANRHLSSVLVEYRSSVQLLSRLQEIGKLSGWWFDPQTRKVHHTLEYSDAMGEFDLDDESPQGSAMALTREELRALITAATISGEPWDREMLCTGADGDKAWYRSIGRIERDGEQTIRFVGVLHDITETRLAQARRAHSQKLEAMGTLAAGIAHEINTPVQYVADNVAFVNESLSELRSCLQQIGASVNGAGDGDGADNTDTTDTTGTTDTTDTTGTTGADAQRVANIRDALEEADVAFMLEELPRALAESADGLERIGRIVHTMKAMAHPGSEASTPMDLNEVIRSTVLVCANRWKRVADLQTDYDERLPMAPCLPGQINQVILNLLVNAADAIQELIDDGVTRRGTIAIATRADREFAEIRITDSGCGIPEDIRERIYEPFFTTKEVGKGTGQGLAISYDVIVNRHGGELLSESTPGAGTTFKIRLPLRARQDQHSGGEQEAAIA